MCKCEWRDEPSDWRKAAPQAPFVGCAAPSSSQGFDAAVRALCGEAPSFEGKLHADPIFRLSYVLFSSLFFSPRLGGALPHLSPAVAVGIRAELRSPPGWSDLRLSGRLFYLGCFLPNCVSRGGCRAMRFLRWLRCTGSFPWNTVCLSCLAPVRSGFRAASSQLQCIDTA